MAGVVAAQPCVALARGSLQSSSAGIHQRGQLCGQGLAIGVSQGSSKSRRWQPLKVTAEGSGLSKQQGGRWLSCTTRHVRLFAGELNPETRILDQSDEKLGKLSLILDPDNEFVWPEDKEQQVYAYFTELVDNYAGADLTEYTLRLIGSDIEHYIRGMLLKNEIKYNLNCRVLNFSMGRPRIEGLDVEDEE